MQDHDERDGLWAQVHGRRAQGVRGLQRMPALHAPATRAARADVHAKPAHDRTHNREVFLELVRDPHATYGAAAVGTGRRQGHSCVS